MIRFATLFVLLGSLTFSGVAMGDCLVSNSGFDTAVPAVGSATGWTMASPLGGWSPSGGNPGPYFWLNDAGQAGADPSATQVVSGLTPGAPYVLCGDYASIAHDFSPTGATSFAVEINGAVMFSDSPTTIGKWHSFAVPFSAPLSGSITIKARAEINSTDNDFGIDNFCIKPQCLLQNGGFDVSVPAVGSAAGWTTSSSLGGWSATGGHPGAYFWLNDGGQQGSDPSATQTLMNLAPNTCYILTGDYASIAHDFSPIGGISFAIDVDGTTAFTSAPTPIRTWKPFTVPFQSSNSGTATIRFRAETGTTDNDYGIDNLCVTPCCMAPVVFDGGFDDSIPAVGTGEEWTTSSPLGGWSNTGGHPGSYFWLNDNGGSSDPSARQVVHGLTPNAPYTLTGEYASIAHDFSPIGGISFRAEISTGEVFTSAPTPIQTWMPFAIPFTAPPNGIVEITFNSEINGTDNDFGIDNICIVPGRRACAVSDGDFGVSVPAVGSAEGWVTSSALGGWSATGGNPDGYFWLNDAGQPGSDPQAEQVVCGLTPGVTYLITGDYASIAHNFSPIGGPSFAIDVDHQNVYSAAPTTPIQTWKSFVVGFTAPASGCVTITFRAETGGTDNDFGIDNICISAGTTTRLTDAGDRGPTVPGRIMASPNPFPRSTSVSFTLQKSENVDVGVFDVAGRLVRHLRSGILPAGEYRVDWDGRDDDGQVRKGAVSFIRLKAGDTVLGTKVVQMP